MDRLVPGILLRIKGTTTLCLIVSLVMDVSNLGYRATRCIVQKSSARFESVRYAYGIVK